jgi:hypothetical protein
MAGAGTISASGVLDLRMTGTRPGAAPVPFAIRGTCNEPVFRPVAR